MAAQQPPTRDTTPDPWTSSRRGRGARGVLAAAGVSLALLPVHMFVLGFAVLAAGRYDSSGRGGPFRSCTADSTVCSGPEYGMIALCIAVFVGTAWLAGLAGAKSGQYRHVWRSRIALAAMSVATAVGSAAGGWWFMA